MARMPTLFLLAALACGANPGLCADSPEGRLQAAQRLFELPAYRQLATRQIHAALKALPDAEYARAADALDNPAVVQALRGVIVRSMARTFTEAELGHIGRFLAAEEAKSMVAKIEGFESVVIRELLAAAMTDPELARRLLAK
ncbi:MAG TPA: hypothetical protein VHA15_12100 [Burkholderiales bacterium]|nr:hypothetical protein [Burkholderiales bacterium]